MGMMCLPVYNAVHNAVEEARKGKGPSLIELINLSISDRTMKEADENSNAIMNSTECQKNDPIVVFKQTLMSKRVLKEKDVKIIAEDVKKEIEEALEFAKQSPLPGPQDSLLKIFLRKTVR